MKWGEKSLSCVWLFFESLWTVAHQVPLSMEFSRQEYWSGLPFPSLAGIPILRTEIESPASQADSLPFERPGNVTMVKWSLYILIFQYCYMMFTSDLFKLPLVQKTLICLNLCKITLCREHVSDIHRWSLRFTFTQNWDLSTIYQSFL